MLRARSRQAAACGLLALSLLGLTACGSDEGDPTPGKGLDSVTIEGDHGKAPKVTFDGRLDPDEATTEVLVEGDGETIEDGDTVSMHYWIGNGFTEEEAQSTFDATPEAVELTEEISKPFREALIGQKVGARVAVLSSAEDAFGEYGNSQLGIGNKDAVLFVVDVLGKVEVLDGPQGEDKEPAGWAPSLIEKDGVVTGLDFSDAHEPGGNLLSTTLVKGDGPVVKKGQTIYVDYLGQVYDAEKPFDESYSKEPAEFQIGVGAVVKGWDESLVGRTVGSRVILEIPPAKGYGKKGNEQAGIKGTDTLFFVIDILGVR